METLKKTDFIEKMYNLIKTSREEFERVCELPERTSDAVFNVQTAIQYGTQYIEAYNQLKLGMISNPELYVYYTNGTVIGFCDKEEYEKIKDRIISESTEMTYR